MIEVKNGTMHGWIGGEYIGRTGYGLVGTPLANPYAIGRDGSREEVLLLYRYWIANKLVNKTSEAYLEFKRLLGLYRSNNELVLLCWCKPLACHGDVIKTLLEHYQDKDF